MIDPAVRVNWNHPLNRGLVSWWLAGVPGLSTGNRWTDITRRFSATATNFSTTSTIKGTNRRGGTAELTRASTAGWFATDIPKATLPNMTVAIWMKYTYAFGNYAGGRYAYPNGWVLYNETWFKVTMGASGAWKKQLRTTNSVNDGNWHYAGFTFSPDIVTLYLDGREPATTVIQNDTMTAVDSQTAATLGIGGIANTYGFLGSLDCCRIWYRTLSAKEMYQDYLLTSQRYSPLFASLPSVENAVATGFQPAWGRSANHLISAV